MNSTIHRIKDDEPGTPKKARDRPTAGLEPYRPCASCIAQRMDTTFQIFERLVAAHPEWSLVRTKVRADMEYAKGVRE